MQKDLERRKTLAGIVVLLAAWQLLVASSPRAVATESAKVPGWKLLNLDFDHSVSAQKKLEPLLDDRKDLHASVDAIRLWTNTKGMKVLRTAVAELRKKYPEDKWLTFTGSGDFHQTTATLIESLPQSARPVTIILFDNHPDWFKAPAHYHCGAWVVQALKQPWVERVIMIGQNSADLRGDQFRWAPFNELCKGRVQMHPLLRETSFVPLIWRSKVLGVESCKRSFLGTQLRFASLRGIGLNSLSERLTKSLAGKNVYISIDKDVLDPKFTISDWDQGELTLTELTTLIGRIADSANLVGMDVCGERAPEPVHGLLRTLDAHRIHRKVRNFEQANLINQETNLEIIKAVHDIASVNKSVSGSIERKRKP